MVPQWFRRVPQARHTRPLNGQRGGSSLASDGLEAHGEVFLRVHELATFCTHGAKASEASDLPHARINQELLNPKSEHQHPTSNLLHNLPPRLQILKA